MWFSSVLSKTIKRLFGDYIEGLDNISLPIWPGGSGDITLENLTINKKQLTTPELPIEVVQGTISKFSLHIPWMHLNSQPITVKIDGLYLLATRKDFDDMPRSAGESESDDEGLDMESIYKVKEKGVDVHKEQSYFSRFIKKVMENIQVSVTNVHICYQDSKSTANHTFAVGLTLDSLSVTTTDSEWIPLPVHSDGAPADLSDEGGQVHKLVTFFNLAVYWDTDMGLGRTVDTTGSDAAPMLSVGIPRHKADKERSDHQYLVEPLSGLLRATIKGGPDIDEEEDEESTSPSIPHISASFGLKEVDITLQSNQYRDLLNLLSFLRDWDVKLRYARFRPEEDVKSDPKGWWLFAFKAVRKELRKRSGIHMRWSELATRRNDRRAYIKIFKKKLLTHRLIRVERDLLNVLEKKLTYEDVIFYRAIAQRELADERKKQLDDPMDVYQNSSIGEGVSSVSGFIASLIKWPFQAQEKPQDQALTDEEMRDIFESTKTNPEKLLRRYDAAAYYSWAGTVQCNVRILRVTIADWVPQVEGEPDRSPVRPLCSLTLTDGDIRGGLGEKTAHCSVTVGSVVIDDTSTPHTAYTRVVGPTQGTFTTHSMASGNQPMISMEIVQNPSGSNADYALAATLAPITIVYSVPLITTLARFLTRGDELALAKLRQTLLEQIHQLQQKLYEEIKSVIRTQKTADAAFQIHVPTLIVPETHEKDDGPALIIQGGLLKLESEPRKPKSSQMDAEGNDLAQVIDTRTRWRAAHSHHDAMQRDLLGCHESHTSHTLHSVNGTEAAISRPAGSRATSDEMWYYDAYAASWEGFGIHLVVPVVKKSTTVSSTEFASSSQSASVTIATPVPLLEPTACQLLLEVCALPYNIDLPQMILCGHISPLKCQVTREHMLLLGRIAASLGLMEQVPVDPAAPPSQSGVRVKKRSTMEMFDIMTDVKDFIKTRKHTHEKLQNCILMQGQITLPLVTGVFGYKEGAELRVVASRVAIGAVTGVYRMDTELRVFEMSVTDSKAGELLKFSHPVNPITPSEVFSKGRDSGESQRTDSKHRVTEVESESSDGEVQEKPGNAKRSSDGGDMYNPISESIDSTTKHPSDKETSRIVVDAAPILPFLTCKIRNVARSSLEYDYTDYFVDTTLGPCQIAIDQDVVISCLKVYYFAMAEACKSKTKPEEEKPPKHKKKPREPRRSYRDDVLAGGEGAEEVWDIKSNIKLSCEKLGIKLKRRSGDVALFELTGLGVEGETQGKATDFRVGVSAISIQDLTPEGVKYKPVMESLGKGSGLHFPPIPLTPREKVVALRPNEWMAIRLVSFDDTRPAWPGYHYALTAHSAPFRFVFLMQFANTLRRFADRIDRKMVKYDLHLSRAKVTGETSHNGDYSYHNDDLCQREAEEDAKEAPRIKIDAVISAPQIILPRSAKADEVIVLHLQQVSIHNFFNMDKEGVNVGNTNNVNAAQELKLMKIEHTIIQLAGCVPHSATLTIDRKNHTHTRPLAEKPLDVKIHFTRNLEAANIDPIRMRVSTRVLPMLLTRAQFNNLLLLIRHNINESVVGPPPSATAPLQPPANLSEEDSERLKLKQQRWATIEIILTFDACMLHLFDEKSDPFPFGHLGLEHVTLKAKMYSDNETTMHILTHSLVLSSAVGGRGSELREIFRTEYSDPLTDQFELLDYKADAKGVQNIKLAVDSPRIYLVLARATQVINFITPADDPDVPPPQPSVNSINAWEPVNTLTVSMINSQIMLMSDFTKEYDDNAMVVCGDMQITWQASADNCQKLTIKVRGLHSGMRRVNGPPMVEDVYSMLRREDESHLGTARKKTPKVNTEVTHEMERERGLTNRRKQAQEQLALAKEALAKAMAGPSHDLGDQFIRPINIEVQANLVPTGEPVPSNVVLIHIDPVEMVLKSRTINAMAHIAASLNEALASFSTDTSRPPAPPTRPPRVEYASAVESGPVTEKEVMAVASTQTLIPPVAVDMTGPPYQIIINTQGFRMSFVDDLTSERGRLNAPLVAFKSDSCVAKINLTGGQTNIRLDSVLEACYFNPYLAVWEPFIEPWQCRVLMQTAPYSMIEINSSDHLNVNVTPALVEEVTKTLMPWCNVALSNVMQNATSQTQASSLVLPERTGVPPPPPTTSQLDEENKVAHWRATATAGYAPGKNMWYSPFWVTNLVGVAISYRVERTGGKAIGDWQRLEPHESAPVSISEMSMLDMDQFALSRLVLVVLLDLPASNQLIRADTSLYVPLHRVRKYEYQVQIGDTQEQPSLTEDIEPENNNNTPTKIHVVCDVRAQYGSKAVIVQAPVILENHTELDIEVGLDIPPVSAHPGRTKHVGPQSTRPRPLVPLATLPPHTERAPLPLSRISTAKLRLRPVSNINLKVPGPQTIKVPPLDMPVATGESSSRSIVGVVPADAPPQDHGWSVNVVDFWSMDEGDDTIVRCGPDFSCRVVVHRKHPNMVLKICPVIEIYNYLPCTLHYNLIPSRPPKPMMTPAEIEDAEASGTISRRRGRTMFEGNLAPEAMKSMTDVFVESSFSLSIGIPPQEEGATADKICWSKPITFTKGANEDLHVVKVNPYSGKGSLRINARFKNYKGTFRLEFFNQVWITNQTGIPLYLIKSKANSLFSKPAPMCLRSTDTNTVSYATCPPTMVSFPQLDPSRNKAGLAVKSSQRISEPSESFSLSAIGYRGVAVVNQCAPEDAETNRSYHVGVSIDLASNKRTKLVKLTPRYVLVNDGVKAMSVGQPGTNYVVRIGAGERVPLLYWVQSPNCPQILRMNMDADDQSASWSASFDIKTVGELTLKMERPITIQGYSSINYIKVHKVLCDSTIYVIFSPSAKAPYYIDNQTDMTLLINQQGIQTVERVPPKSMVPYAWDQPLQPHKLEVQIEDSRFKAIYRLDKLKVYPTRKVEWGEMETDIAASIVPEAASRVLRLAYFNRHPPHAPTEEVVDQQFRINLRAVGVSVISEINHVPHEILYASLDDIYANFSNSDLFQKLEVKLGNLQVDNQLATVKNYLHPVLLSSVKANPNQPFFHLSFVNSNTVPSRSTTHVHYLSALLQEIEVKLEERLIYRLMDFSNILGFSDKREHPTLDEGSLHDAKQFESASVHLDTEALRKQSDNRMYLELLVLNPLKVNLTFHVSHMGLGKKSKETPLLEFCRNLGFTLVSFENAPLRLNALTLRHAFGSMTDIQQPLQKHYIQQGLREAYKVLGSFDLIGNPIHLVRDLGTGVKDFFVEPSRGITHSTEDFRTGLAKGSTSLMKHTVYALANTTTSLTETTARGFAAMSMDKDYLSERDRILREPPSNFGEGVVQGAKGLRAGVKYGISGVVMLPYKGHKQEGAVGLAKGIPKGLAGVVLKPTAGAADLVALSSQSVRNMSDPAPKLERKRTPRHFPCDGALAEYNAEKAYGGYLMQALFKHDTPPTSGSSVPSKSEMDHLIPSSSSSSTKVVVMTSSPFHSVDESYVFHIIWRNSTTLLFTNRRLACFADPKAIRKRWDILLANVALTRLTEKGVKLKLNHPVRKNYKVNKTNSVLIKCPDSTARQYIYHMTLRLLESSKPSSQISANLGAARS